MWKIIIICLFYGYAHAKDTVLVLHGIAWSSSHMTPLAEHLRSAGYDVLNHDYASTEHKIEVLARQVIDEALAPLPANTRVHMVGYSMGGLLVRQILATYRPQRLGRVVLLAPPNQGSEVADWLQNFSPYQWLYGPAGQQLVTNITAREGLFGPIDYSLGVIAGNSTIDPISSYIIPGEDDGKVSVRSTYVKGLRDHITISASHLLFPSNAETHAQTLHFLRYEQFKRTPLTGR